MRPRRQSFRGFALYNPEEAKNSITEPNRAFSPKLYEPLLIENSIASIAQTKKTKIVFSHFSVMRRIWEYVIFIISVSCVFEIPFYNIFITDFRASIYWPFIIIDLIFAADLFVVLNTSFVSHGVFVSDKKRIRELYGKTSIVFHAIAAFPLAWIGIFAHSKIAYAVLSLPKLLRMNRAMIAIHTFNSNLVYYSWFSQLLPLVTILIFIVHLFACLFYLSAYLSKSDDTWINILGWSYLTPPQLYVTSIYFVMTTIFAIGYGDLTPQASCEVIVVIPIQVIGVTTNLMILSKLVELSLHGIDKKYIRDTREFFDFIKFKKLPKDIIEDTTNYFQMRYTESHGADDPSHVMKYLPETLRTTIVLDQCRFSLMQVDMFRVANQSFLSAISRMLRPRAFIPGETIIKQNDVVPELLMLNKGILQVLVDGNEIGRPEFQGGASFGDLELFIDKPRESTIKAVTHISGWSIMRIDLQMCIARQPELRKEVNNIAKLIYPAYVKQIRAVVSTLAIEQVLDDMSDSESSDSEADVFLGPKIMSSSSDSEDSFEIM